LPEADSRWPDSSVRNDDKVYGPFLAVFLNPAHRPLVPEQVVRIFMLASFQGIDIYIIPLSFNQAL